MSATGCAGTMQRCDGPFWMAGTDFVQGHEVDFPDASIGSLTGTTTANSITSPGLEASHVPQWGTGLMPRSRPSWWLNARTGVMSMSGFEVTGLWGRGTARLSLTQLHYLSHNLYQQFCNKFV